MRREHQHWIREGATYKEVFDSFQGGPREFFEKQQEAILNYLQELEFETVLEFGCGFGRITRLLLDRFPERITKYVGFDISEDQVRHAKELCPEASITRGVIEEFSPGRSFDLVLGVETLMHLSPIIVGEALKRILSWSVEHVIHVDQDPPPQEGVYRVLPTQGGSWSVSRVAFNYYHPFDSLYHWIGVEPHVEQISSRQRLYHVRKQ